VILSDTTIVQPDIVFVGADRLERINERGIEGAPTLVVEILLPRTRQIDRYIKTRLYARPSIPYYWMVDRDAHGVECYTLESSNYTPSAWLTGNQTLNAAPLPDLGLPLASLWA
jgi:Uma2 family endonuclease